MRTRLSVALLIVCLLGVTSVVVVRDLQNARERNNPDQQLARGSVNLESIAVPESPFLEDRPLTGQPEHALLEEDLHPENLLHLIADAEGQQALPLTANVPSELPAADGLDPVPLLSPQKRKENAAIIKQIMPKISEDQLEFWLEETRDLPSEMIRNMLTIRQQFGGLTDNFASDRPTQKSVMKSPMELELTADTLQKDPTLESLQRARKIVLQNLMNQHSIGYLARELHFVEAHSNDPTGVQLARTSLSLKDGQYHETNRHLDISLYPSLFLIVEENGESRLTRYGSLKVGDDRRLRLAIDDVDLIVSETIIIPEKIAIAGIDERGRVIGSEKPENQNEEDWKEIGKLELVTVRDPSALRAVGNACYITTTESGPALSVIDREQEEFLIPGMLMKSNVDPQQENWTLVQINQWIELRKQQLASDY